MCPCSVIYNIHRREESIKSGIFLHHSHVCPSVYYMFFQLLLFAYHQPDIFNSFRLKNLGLDIWGTILRNRLSIPHLYYISSSLQPPSQQLSVVASLQVRRRSNCRLWRHCWYAVAATVGVASLWARRRSNCRLWRRCRCAVAAIVGCGVVAGAPSQQLSVVASLQACHRSNCRLWRRCRRARHRSNCRLWRRRVRHSGSFFMTLVFSFLKSLNVCI